MLKNNFKLYLAMLLSIFSQRCFGQQLGIYWENDGTWATPNSSEDRHYTNGTRLDLSWETSSKNLIDFGSFISGIRQDNHNKPSIKYNFGVFVTHHMQTPDHISKPKSRPKYDMKYAALLYGGPFIQISDKNSFTHFELGLGVLGPSALGKHSQDIVHDLRGLDKAVDWDTQMSDRFAFDFSWIKKVRFCDSTNTNMDFIGESFVTAGSVHRHGGLGITARYGINLPNNFEPSKISSPALYNLTIKDSYFFIFGRIAGSYVEYNQFLAELNKNDFLGEAQVGLSAALGDFELSYSQVFMTRQYKYQPENDSYGSIICRLRF